MSTDQNNQSIDLPLPKLLLWSLLFFLAWHWRTLAPVLSNGELPGPDDYLRLHQAMSWWSGQGWFDLKIDRLIGNDLHWSRIVEVPLALIAAACSLFVEEQTAWRLATIIWPLALFLAVILVLALLCDHLAGKQARLFVLLFAGLNSFTMLEFSPGRVDHHNLQILLLLICIYSLFLSSPTRIALGIGLSIALSVSIGLEIVILFIPVLAAVAFSWVLGFHNGSQIITRTGIALGLSSLVLFGLTIPPDQYFVAHCDANSIVYLTAFGGVSIAFCILGSWSRLIGGREEPNPIRRLAAGIILAGILLAVLLTLFPNCLDGPLGNVSQELNNRWLSNVTEAHGLIAAANANAGSWFTGVAYLVLMLCIAVFITFNDGKQKPELWVVLTILIVCAAVSLFQVRVLRTGIFSAIPFCVLFAVLALRWFDEKISRSYPRIGLQILTCLVLTSFFWSIVALPFVADNETKENSELAATNESKNDEDRALSLSNPDACYGMADFGVLNTLPDGLVITDLNLAPSLLVHTGHRSVSGSYHRNGAAILSVYDFFQSPSDTALANAKALGVRYVATCRLNSGIEMIEPTHLNSRIEKGDFPDWLQLKSEKDARLLVFEVTN